MRLPDPKWSTVFIILFGLAAGLMLSTEVKAAPGSNDAVYLHYDVAADPDDLQAIIAGKQLADKLNVSPNVIIGTHTHKSTPGDWQFEYIRSEANAIASAMYGSNYRDVGYNHNGHDNGVAAEWDAVVRRGGRVYVAEGGPSDFTARVLQRMSTDTQQVTVVQHSTSWNQLHTESSAMDYVRSVSDYRVIADGNGINATAGFRELKTDARINQLVATNSAWRTAIDAHWEAVDFSDTVEFLYIMDVGIDQVRTIDDFISYVAATAPQGRCEARSIGDLNQCLASGNDAYIASDLSCSGQCIFQGSGTIYGQGYTITRNSGQRQGSLLIMQGSGLGVRDVTFDDGGGSSCLPREECPRTIQMSGSNITFNNVTVRNSKAYTIGVDNVTDATFNRLTLIDGGIVGLYIGNSNRVTVVDSTFRNVGSNAVAVLGGNNVTIDSNTFEGNHARGFWPVAPQFGSGMTGGGQLYVARGNNVTVTDNTIINGSCAECRGGVSGIEIGFPNESQVSGLTLTGNIISNNSGPSIYVNQGVNLTNSDISNGETVTVPDSSNDACFIQVVGVGYAEAYGLYSNACSIPRVDCDSYQGSIVCASVRMDSVSDIESLLGSGGVTEPEPELPEPEQPQPTDSCYTVSSRSIGFGGAYGEYGQSCSLPRADCDVSGSSIVCASFNLNPTVLQELNLSEPEQPDTPTNTTSTVYRTLPLGVPSQAPGGLSWADSFSYQNRCYISSTFDHGAGNLTIGGVNVRVIQRDQNAPSISLADAHYNDVNCGNGPPNEAGDEDWCPGRVDMGRSGCVIAGPDIRNQL